DDAAACVLDERAGLGQPRALEALRVVDVRGEEDVERCAVLNLRGEVAGRSERERHLAAARLLELGGDGGQRGLQIGRGGEREVLRGRRARHQHEQRREHEESGAHHSYYTERTDLSNTAWIADRFESLL